MTRPHSPDLRAKVLPSRNWKQIERTVHKPGEWRQTPTGFERVPS